VLVPPPPRQFAPFAECAAIATAPRSALAQKLSHAMAEAGYVLNLNAWDFCLKGKRLRKQREDFPREAFQTAPWQEMIDSLSYQKETTKQGRNFRRKFRVPASLFDFVVATVLHRQLFPEYDQNGCGRDAFGRPIATIHVKILIVFRLLGTGGDFSTVYDGTKVDEQTARKFFHRFNQVFVRSLYGDWVHPPSSKEQVDEALTIYKRLGLPGAIGSTDCFHLFWDRCPAQLKVDCRNGRYTRCTLVWSVSNDHHRKIYALTDPFHGTVSDKTIQVYDGFLQSVHLKTNPLFGNVQYTLFDDEGTPKQREGAWIISDNGYHKWNTMQCPPTTCTSQEQVIFREVIESARYL
jgi:hypothetical protein